MDGIITTIDSEKPDRKILDQLLSAQNNYFAFENKLGAGDGSSFVCRTSIMDVFGSKIRFNAINTAIMSQNPELQGSLYVPTSLIDQLPDLDSDTALSITALHHSYLWLESNAALRLRSSLERISDIAISGHQHFSHSFYKANSTGETILYIEAGALQDEHLASNSSFEVLLFDLGNSQQRTFGFKWTKDTYAQKNDSGWRDLKLNRSLRHKFYITSPFERFLSDPGANYSNEFKPNLVLRDFFVYPGLEVRTSGGAHDAIQIKSDKTSLHISESSRLLIQAPTRGGKTSLAKMVYQDVLRNSGIRPVWLNGPSLKTSTEEKICNLIKVAIDEQYEGQMFDMFNFLEPDNRALIIDDWHSAKLSPEGRNAFLKYASAYFGHVWLFCGDSFQLQEIADPDLSTLVKFDHAKIARFGPLLQGRLIDNWLTLGRKYTLDTLQLQQETEEVERLLNTVLGKNTLPPLPFFILCILQAHHQKKLESPEDGAFGYLYEVLVTTALSKTLGAKPQLDKKYTFLTRLAYKMFKADQTALSVSEARDVAEEYSSSHMVKVDIESMFADLEAANVLLKLEGNYSFHYPHLFYYFIARYYRDNLKGSAGAGLFRELEEIVDLISSDQNLTVLLFVLYFVRDSPELLNKLIQSAGQVFQQVPCARLENDTGWVEKQITPLEQVMDEEYDVQKNREARRELRDRMDRNEKALEEGELGGCRFVRYSSDLTDAEKADFARRYIELFGHLIRNDS